MAFYDLEVRRRSSRKVRNARGRKEEEEKREKWKRSWKWRRRKRRDSLISPFIYPNYRPETLMLVTEMLRRCQLCVQNPDKRLGRAAGC